MYGVVANGQYMHVLYKSAICRSNSRLNLEFQTVYQQPLCYVYWTSQQKKKKKKKRQQRI